MVWPKTPREVARNKVQQASGFACQAVGNSYPGRRRQQVRRGVLRKRTFTLMGELRRGAKIKTILPIPCDTVASGQNLPHHIALDIGEPEIPATVAIREFFVIKPEQVKHRRVQVVDMDFSINRLVP